MKTGIGQWPPNIKKHAQEKKNSATPGGAIHVYLSVVVVAAVLVNPTT